jgi:hypothetical protein
MSLLGQRKSGHSPRDPVAPSVACPAFDAAFSLWWGQSASFCLHHPVSRRRLIPPGVPAERFGFNMKQISTGAGLVALSVGMVATAFITTQRGGEAFAQGTGTERRIVAQGVYGALGPQTTSASQHWGYRIWSDNVTEVRYLGATDFNLNPSFVRVSQSTWATAWQTVDNGTITFLRADVDQSRTVDAGDIGATLLDFGKETGDPPPPIDCTINAPR